MWWHVRKGIYRLRSGCLQTTPHAWIRQERCHLMRPVCVFVGLYRAVCVCVCACACVCVLCACACLCVYVIFGWRLYLQCGVWARECVGFCNWGSALDVLEVPVLLLQKGDTALHCAAAGCRKGSNVDVVAWLVEAGIDPNIVNNMVRRCACASACRIVGVHPRNFSLRMCEIMCLCGNQGWSPLLVACSSGNLMVAQWLVAHGANLVHKDALSP